MKPRFGAYAIGWIGVPILLRWGKLEEEQVWGVGN